MTRVEGVGKKQWDLWLWDYVVVKKAEVEVVLFCLISLESGDYIIPCFILRGPAAVSDSSQAD